jgi:uncharacterized protein YyaL (SSP411 family)
MLRIVRHQLPDHGSSFSNWGMLLLKQLFPFHEVAITGPGAVSASRDMQRHYLPHAVFAAAEGQSSAALLSERIDPTQLRFFICENKVCNLPVNQMDAALKQLGYDGFPNKT